MIKLKIIVAADERDGIGKDGDLPWPRLNADMERFRYLTSFHPVIMGRRTFESIGSPLQNRTSIVMTKQRNYDYENRINVKFANNVFDVFQIAIDVAKGLKVRTVWIIGGASVFEQLLPHTHEIYLTRVHTDTGADIRMPAGWLSGWRMDHQGTMYSQPNALDYTFERYTRGSKI